MASMIEPQFYEWELAGEVGSPPFHYTAQHQVAGARVRDTEAQLLQGRRPSSREPGGEWALCSWLRWSAVEFSSHRAWSREEGSCLRWNTTVSLTKFLLIFSKDIFFIYYLPLGPFLEVLSDCVLKNYFHRGAVWWSFSCCCTGRWSSWDIIWLSLAWPIFHICAPFWLQEVFN